MGFAVPNLHTSSLVNSTQSSINDFTRKYPIVAGISIIALAILARNAFIAATFSGLAIGSIFTFIAFTIINHIFSNREDFSLLINDCFRSLRANSFEQRQQIDLHAEEIRNRIALR